MERVNTIALSPWVGGLNNSEDPIILGLTPEGQQKLVQAENIVFTRTGGRKKRGGQARFNATQLDDGTTASTKVDPLYATTFWRNTTASIKVEELVVCAESSRMYYGIAYGTLTALVFSGVTPAFSHGQITSEKMAEDLFVGYSKTASPLYYLGNGTLVRPSSGNTLVVGVFPNGNLVRQHISRLWVAGDANFPDRLYYSASNLPFSYGTAGGFVDINPGDGDPDGITAIFPPTNTRVLYVAKRSSLYRLDTSDLNPTNWALSPVTLSVGCVNHNTAQAIDQGDVVFCSDRGVHSLGQVIEGTGIIKERFLSKEIQSDFDNFLLKNATSALWAPDLNSYLVGVQRKNQNIFEAVYGFNIELGTWYQWTSVPVNFLFKRLNATNGSYEYYACGDASSSTNTGYINKLQQTNYWDFSSSTGNITTNLKSGLIYPEGNFLIERNWKNIVLLVRSNNTSTIQVSWTIDEVIRGNQNVEQRTLGGNILGSTVLGTPFVLGSPTGAKPLFVDVYGVGNALQVTIKHDTIGKDLQIYGMAIKFANAEESHDAYRTF